VRHDLRGIDHRIHDHSRAHQPFSGGDVVTFATGGYARGLRTQEMRNKIDTDHDGTISQAEFTAYMTKLFDMMDTSKTHQGMITKEEVMFATGGYNRG
jgi:hypothetical protein